MKTCATALLGLLGIFLVSCTSSGGPSGALIGGITGGALGALGDKYIGSQENNGSTTVLNPNGTTSTIGSNGQVTTTQGNSSSTNSTVNISGGSGTGTTGTTTAAGTTNSGNTFISSSNTGSSAWREHSGLITGAVAGMAAGAITDNFRKRDAEKKYDEGYAKAKSDSIKEFYWLKRDAQKTAKGGEDPPVQYRYYEVEVPAHVTSDGVLIDRHRRTIEVVE